MTLPLDLDDKGTGKNIQAAVTVAMANLEDRETRELIQDAISSGLSPIQVLDALREGLEIVGERYDSSEYFVSELVIAGQLMNDAMKILQPYMTAESFAAKGCVVLGSGLGDIHDIGKNIVKTMLVSQGYEVDDLGLDVPPECFVEKAKDVHAKVIGVSALLTTTLPTSADVMKELEKEGLRSEVRVILGGAPVRSDMVNSYHVDAAVMDVMEGMRIIKGWMAT